MSYDQPMDKSEGAMSNCNNMNHSQGTIYVIWHWTNQGEAFGCTPPWAQGG
jgi:hypothetical protein